MTSPIRQGCGALGIQGSGYMPINSIAFVAGGLTVTAALSVDLFIPNNQPNQFYLGALQMYLSCPSVGSYNQYIGQVELTGKPQNAYSTLRFPLPTAVKNTLIQGAERLLVGVRTERQPDEPDLDPRQPPLHELRRAPKSPAQPREQPRAVVDARAQRARRRHPRLRAARFPPIRP